MRDKIRMYMIEDEGIGVVEIILILVVLVALVIVFRKQITTIVENAFSTISSDSETINKGIKINVK